MGGVVLVRKQEDNIQTPNKERCIFLYDLDRKLAELNSTVDRLEFLKDLWIEKVEKRVIEAKAEHEALKEKSRFFSSWHAAMTTYKEIYPDHVVQLWTSLLIPSQIFRKYFRKIINEPSFSYWFLNHEAENFFVAMKDYFQRDGKGSDSLYPDRLKGELIKLNAQEAKAKELLVTGMIDVDKNLIGAGAMAEVEILRALGDYYKTHPFKDAHHTSGFSHPVEMMTKFKFYKPYIESELRKIEVKDNDQTEKKGFPAVSAETAAQPSIVFFDPVIRKSLLDILEGYFSEHDHNELSTLIHNGGNASKKLLFKDNGNKLSDAFRKLIDANFIKGCNKDFLQSWIILNFNFQSRGMPKEYKIDAVHGVVSKNSTPCKSPILEIIDGQLRRAHS